MQSTTDLFTAALRELFLLRPDVHFLNHGSFGACPRPVFEAYQRWQLELERQPVEFLGRRFGDLMRGVRTAIAGFVGATPLEVVPVMNANTGVNIVARSLALEPGDEILATDHEYGASDRAWRFMCRKTGARYVNQPIPVPLGSAGEFVETLWRGVTPRTRVIFLSHITSPTALVFPVADVCARARAEGLLTVVDGAHAPGLVPIDMHAIGADFYTGNCHKWLLAPKGAAFLYARPEAQALLEPLVVSWGWESEFPGDSPFVDHYEWQGTRDISAHLAVADAIAFLNAHDWPRVGAACRALAAETAGRIAALTGRAPLTPAALDPGQQIFAMPLPPCDLDALKRRLYDEYRVEVPFLEWNGLHLVRVSVQAYNTREDTGALLRGLAELLPQVAPDAY